MQTLFHERYKKLNAKQKEAVDTIEGPLLVVAGPGSGKTEILSMRVAKILEETHALASNVLCLTFTESASANMRDRLAKLIGSEAYHVAIHTFHNFCTGIIERHPEYFWKGARFEPADELAQVRVVESIIEKLPHNNSLRSVHPEQGFVYTWPIIKAIGFIKKAGLSPDEFSAVITHNKESLSYINKSLNTLFKDRVSKSIIGIAKGCALEMHTKASEEASSRPFPMPYFPSLVEVVARSLDEVVKSAEESDSGKPISEWRAEWYKTDDDGNKIFKDTRNIDKLEELAKIYKLYREVMFREGRYDFDDMILDCIRAMEDIPSLRYDLQEQYQYILVDEFQDTNDAQMRLLRLLADSEVSEGRPNFMAVGDDDQAVYKFQGAELSNILEFTRMWKDVQIVTLTDNYRSTQNILNAAQHIIRKGSHRLENLLPNIEKTLIASNKELKAGAIIHKELPTVAHEYHFVAHEIDKLIKAGMKPEEIAVITRRHRELGELVPYMRSVGVSVRYEREQNVFLEPHIKELITLSRFVVSLADKHIDEADEYLPEILSYKFWGLNRETIWQVSLASRRDKEGKNWLEVMRESKDKNIKSIASFLLELGGEAPSEPLEFLLDKMIGAHVALSADNADEEDGPDFDESGTLSSKSGHSKQSFVSPFKEYYFNRERFDHARAEYLSFLSSLRVFVRALREYRQGEPLLLKHLVEFVDTHDKNEIPLNDQSPFARLPNAVNLLTAHKAKGLEFETVFVLSCQDDVWAGRGGGTRISMPMNLPIEPAGDTFDDQLRLFYVALTRAKRHLYLTSYTTSEDGDKASKLRFLVPSEEEKSAGQSALYDPQINTHDTPDTHEILTSTGVSFYAPPFRGSEKELLESLLDDYQLSVTHLNNFLNVTKGGPQYFLEQNLLRFPQAKTPSGAYGSAMHRTLEEVLVVLKQEGKVPAVDKVLEGFEKNLRRERLHPSDGALYLERGRSALKIFYENKKETFSAEDFVEFNFKDQGVVIGDAKLTGKIDRIVKIGSGEVSVHDYKTGKARDEWKGSNEYEKIKLYEYERQLLFYRILVENSREFKDRIKAKKGVLEFIEPNRNKVIDLALDLDNEKTERLKKLIKVVYSKILKVDFPDISKYEQSLKGIKQFEDDLLKS
ncbi:MAG: ATP-dependent DNA helicase [Candidatus Paceibacterota bacterium]|jgi:DNA helicase-2/ATP-dependent DNA helicase PcrA